MLISEIRELGAFFFFFVRLQQLGRKMLLRVQNLFLLIWIEGTVHIVVEIQM